MEGMYYVSPQSGRRSVKEAWVSHSIRLVEPGSIMATFCPVAVELCLEEFEAQRGLFELAPPPNAPMTEHVEHEWRCVLDKTRWDGEDGEAIKRLAHVVNDRWLERLRSSQ